ncbi:hypothetical protein CEP51_007381 [Fusarium floridanum]|uniref:Major facilitator superfamily (MFS) profile domain-containing protein n=1 Tax=Fusarium floridanum TaxID=1325733 RepID=A0A428RPF3_9HYPO|nr:hypothetical protein CEP51_007381 [Fusarium floridanum]
MQVIGGIACLPFAPFFADIFGRRHPVAFGSALTVFGAALQGGATNLGMFIAGRFFIGVGNSFAAVAAAPLIAELALSSIIQIFAIYFVPESPRWLIANDRTEQATQILSKYRVGSDEPNELVRFEVDGKEVLARTQDVKQATFAEGDHLQHTMGEEKA